MTSTNTQDIRARLVGVDAPTRPDHAATKEYVDAHGGGGSVDVTDGSTTVSGLTELDFTSGATVTDAGGGVAQVAVAGGGSQTVLTATKTVNSAELLALFDTPVELFAAPGTGKIIAPVLVVATGHTAGKTAYVTSGTEIWIQFGYYTQMVLGSSLFDIPDQDNFVYYAGGAPPDPATPSGTSVAADQPDGLGNSPVMLQNFGDNNLTDGTGTLTVTIAYLLIDVTA